MQKERLRVAQTPVDAAVVVPEVETVLQTEPRRSVA